MKGIHIKLGEILGGKKSILGVKFTSFEGWGKEIHKKT